jgi:hypothetical protein
MRDSVHGQRVCSGVDDDDVGGSVFALQLQGAPLEAIRDASR